MDPLLQASFLKNANQLTVSATGVTTHQFTHMYAPERLPACRGVIGLTEFYNASNGIVGSAADQKLRNPNNYTLCTNISPSMKDYWTVHKDTSLLTVPRWCSELSNLILAAVKAPIPILHHRT